MENRGWRMEDGGWRIEDRGWIFGKHDSILYLLSSKPVIIKQEQCISGNPLFLLTIMLTDPSRYPLHQDG